MKIGVEWATAVPSLEEEESSFAEQDDFVPSNDHRVKKIKASYSVNSNTVQLDDEESLLDSIEDGLESLEALESEFEATEVKTHRNAMKEDA
mmetsp:Transcript_17500/g.25912  ORF Transcript_17500/g.25912 Transcript_17500/m.25912 type:complete len:92 (-) Transcript_17500:49-324(-)